MTSICAACGTERQHRVLARGLPWSPGMPFIVVHHLPLVAIVSMFVIVPAAHATDAGAADPHVRTGDAASAVLLRQAIAGSPFFRTLVDHLNASDVVVYVRTVQYLPPYVDGTLTFLGAGGGRRYVLVSIACRRSNIRAISILGHELQHALEVAVRPNIVDTESFGAAYEQMGHRVASPGWHRAYDTSAAAQAGERVWKEMSGLQNVP